MYIFRGEVMKNKRCVNRQVPYSRGPFSPIFGREKDRFLATTVRSLLDKIV